MSKTIKAKDIYHREIVAGDFVVSIFGGGSSSQELKTVQVKEVTDKGNLRVHGELKTLIKFPSTRCLKLDREAIPDNVYFPLLAESGELSSVLGFETK